MKMKFQNWKKWNQMFKQLCGWPSPMPIATKQAELRGSRHYPEDSGKNSDPNCIWGTGWVSTLLGQAKGTSAARVVQCSATKWDRLGKYYHQGEQGSRQAAVCISRVETFPGSVNWHPRKRKDWISLFERQGTRFLSLSSKVCKRLILTSTCSPHPRNLG